MPTMKTTADRMGYNNMRANDPKHPVNGKSLARSRSATVTDLMGQRHPEGPLTSKDRVATSGGALQANKKAPAKPGSSTARIKPDGNVAVEMRKRGQSDGVGTLAEAAKRLYPSSR